MDNIMYVLSIDLTQEQLLRIRVPCVYNHYCNRVHIKILLQFSNILPVQFHLGDTFECIGNVLSAQTIRPELAHCWFA